MSDPRDKPSPSERVVIHFPPDFPIPQTIEQQRAWLAKIVREHEELQRKCRLSSHSTS